MSGRTVLALPAPGTGRVSEVHDGKPRGGRRAQAALEGLLCVAGSRGHCASAGPPAPVQDIVFQLQRFVSTMSKYYNDCYAVLRDADVFPIEVDLAHTTLAYGLNQDEFTDGEDEEDEDDEDTAPGEPSRDAQGAAGPLDKGGSWCDS